MWLGERSGCVEEIRLLVPSRLSAAPSAAGSVPSLLPRRGPGGVSACRTETAPCCWPGWACQVLCVIVERPGGAVKAPVLDQLGDSSSSKGNSWPGKSCFEGLPRESRDRLWGHSAA